MTGVHGRGMEAGQNHARLRLQQPRSAGLQAVLGPLDGHQPGGVLPPHSPEIPTIHGPISIGPPPGNRVYFAYGTNSNRVMQIVDRDKLLTGSPNDYKTAEIGRLVMSPAWGAHVSFPVLGLPIADWAPNAGGSVRTSTDHGSTRLSQ